jgi:tetratricopeptide (TPR) repeat protein
MCRLHGLAVLLIASSNFQAFAQDRGGGETWLKLGRLRQDAARYRDAEQAYRKAIALLKPRSPIRLADAMDSLGTMYAECGEFAKAGHMERKALSIRERENDVPGIGRSHTHLAILLLAKNDLAAAEAEAQIAANILVPTPLPEDQMSALINLSLVQCARQACPSAIPQLRRALTIAHDNYAEASIPVGFIDFLLGYALWKSGDIYAAEEFLSAGTRELSTQLSWGHPMYVRAMKQYATFLTQTGNPREAQEVRTKIAKFDPSPGTIDIQSLAFR